MAFVILRSDVRSFSPNHSADREFSEALLQAAASGVEVHAYACRVTRRCVEISHTVPVDLR